MILPALIALLAGLPPIAGERGEAAFRPTPAEAHVPELFRLPSATFAYELEPIRDSGSVHRRPGPVPVAPGHARRGQQHGPRRVFPAQEGAGRGRPSSCSTSWVPTSPYPATTPPAWPTGASAPSSSSSRTTASGGRPARPSGSFPTTSTGRRSRCGKGSATSAGPPPGSARRAEVDPARLGVTGISLGGITSALALAVDPALDRSAWHPGRRRARRDPLEDGRARRRSLAAGVARLGPDPRRPDGPDDAL